MVFRTPRPPPMATQKYLVWKVKPPGPEQLELDRLFTEKKIDFTTTADSVHNSKEIFKRFSTSVFGSHFRSTKAKFGLSATIPAPEQSGVAEKSDIPELGALKRIANNQILSSERETEDYVEPNSPITIYNPPFSTWMYTDHGKKRDYICLAVPIFSGSRGVKFTISDDGMSVTIHFVWPEAVFNPSLLYGEAIQQGRIQLSHPKLHAFASKMIQEGLTKNSEPRGGITIELPRQVKRETNSWKFEALKVDGASIALMQFTAHQNSLFVDDADTTFNF